MTTPDRPHAPPAAHVDDAAPARLRLTGDWTIEHATALSQALADAPCALDAVDATGIARLDSLGVLQLLRFSRRCGADFSAFDFRDEHRALVSAIEDVADDRPRRKREYGVAAALERMGHAVQDNAREVLALVAFLGETLAKLVRTVKEPTRFRPVALVHHMEQVGFDAVPLVAVLSFLVGAVIAFLGADVLRDFGAEIYVVELVNIAFLREFGVLLTAIILAGRTASAFTAQIGSMKSREEIDAIRTLGMDPIDLLVIPRLLALLVMLPLLTFVANIAGLLGGLVVGSYGLDIPPEQYLTRMHETIDVRHLWVGLSKAPVFATVIALVGCLEGLQVQGTAQSVGERTTSAVVQAIAMVIVLDAFAALWFMVMDF